MRRAKTLLPLLLCGLVVDATAQTTGHINGRVMDEKDRPVSGVTVTLVGPTTSGRPTTTDARGEFRFYQLPPGKYTVWTEEPGQRAAWRGVIVRTGATTRVNLGVRIEQGAAHKPCPLDREDSKRS